MTILTHVMVIMNAAGCSGSSSTSGTGETEAAIASIHVRLGCKALLEQLVSCSAAGVARCKHIRMCDMCTDLTKLSFVGIHTYD